ncbi:MAG: carbohydrate ABC transporter permease [Candidatus Izemoplasmataceae bacterium]
MTNQKKITTDNTQRYYQMKQRLVPYLFLAPNLLIFTIFIIVPAFVGIYYSFTNFDGLADPTFVGVENYVEIFTDGRFLSTMWNTIRLVAATVPIVFFAAMFIAILIVQPLRGRPFFRAAYYWPVMISFIVVGVMWSWIFNADFGLVNPFLSLFGIDKIETLKNPFFAWWGVVFIFTWNRAGYYMVMFAAALLSIPTSLYEAAKVDGANKWQTFKFVTYPALKPARVMVFILATMEVFKTFAIVVTFTDGGPYGTTEFIVQYIYETAFESYDVGLASAMSVIMIIIVTIFTGFNFIFSKRGGEE